MTGVNPKLTEMTAVYKLYDALGNLLYVGITIDPETRFKTHAGDKWWWPLVYRTELEWTVGFRIAECIEKHLIKTLKPKYNVRGTPKHGQWWANPEHVRQRNEKQEVLARYAADPKTSRYAYAYAAEEMRRRLKLRQAAVAAYAARLVVVPARQVLRQLRRQLDSVMEDGKTLVVTKRGKAVCLVIPIEEYEEYVRLCREVGRPVPDVTTLEVA